MRFTKHKNLLPLDAYPSDPFSGKPMGARARRKFDQRIEKLLHTIPTEPGQYVDGVSDLWTLDAEGGWTDKHGERRDARYTPILALFIANSGPFLRVERLEADQTDFIPMRNLVNETIEVWADKLPTPQVAEFIASALYDAGYRRTEASE